MEKNQSPLKPLKPLFADIAAAIREKDGSTGTIPAEAFPARIRAAAGMPEGVCSISVIPSDPEGGTVTGGGVASSGMKVTVEAAVADDYTFEGWKENEAVVHAEPEYTFKVEGDRELIAAFSAVANPSGLPAGYTQVDYIVAKSADSFINTGIPISSAAPWTSIAYKLEGPAEIESEGYPIAITGNSYYSLYASAYQTTRNGVVYLIYYGSNSTWVVEKNWTGNYKPFFGLITKETFTDTTFNKSVTVANAGSINGMLCLNGNGVNRKGFSGLKLFNLTAEDNGIHKHELVPCIREADGIAGMYDIIQRAFYTSSGTDSFTAGPAV